MVSGVLCFHLKLFVPKLLLSDTLLLLIFFLQLPLQNLKVRGHLTHQHLFSPLFLFFHSSAINIFLFLCVFFFPVKTSRKRHLSITLLLHCRSHELCQSTEIDFYPAFSRSPLTCIWQTKMTGLEKLDTTDSKIRTATKSHIDENNCFLPLCSFSWIRVT